VPTQVVLGEVAVAAQQDHHIRQLEALGCTITLQPAASIDPAWDQASLRWIGCCHLPTHPRFGITQRGEERAVIDLAERLLATRW
jgi:hypothetical protein